MSLSAEREQPLLQAEPDAVVMVGGVEGEVNQLPALDEEQWDYVPFESRKNIDPETRFKRHFPEEYQKLTQPADAKVDFAAIFPEHQRKVYGDLTQRQNRIKFHVIDGNLAALLNEKSPLIDYLDISELIPLVYDFKDQPMLDYFYSLCVAHRHYYYYHSTNPFLLLSAITTHQPISVLEALVRDKQEPVNHRGHPPLATAARYGYLSAIRFLCERGADINYGRLGRIPALAAAVYYSRFDSVKCLVEYKADIEVKRAIDDATPLLISLTRKSPQITAFLLDAGANSEATDSYRNTALGLAVHHKNLEGVELLIKKRGSSLEFTKRVHDAISSNPLDYAFRLQFYKGAALLLWPTIREELSKLIQKLEKKIALSAPLNPSKFFSTTYDAAAHAQVAAAKAFRDLIDSEPNFLQMDLLQRFDELGQAHRILAYSDPVGLIFQKFFHQYQAIRQELAKEQTQRPSAAAGPA